MKYDGTGKLADAIADLYGVPPKSQVRIAALIKEAKAGLSIESKSKRLPDDVKLAIWRWHYDRLNPACDIQQTDIVQNIKQDDIVYDVKQTKDDGLGLLLDNAVQDIKQSAPSQLDDTESSVYDVKQNAPAQLDDDTDSPVYDFKQVHFAITVATKRTTVMLEGYLVKALQRKHGLIDNSSIRAWIEQSIKADGIRFDPDAALTRQVKRLIVESFTGASRDID